MHLTDLPRGASTMICTPRLARAAKLSVASPQSSTANASFSFRQLRRSSFFAAWVVLALMVSGAWRSAAAQTAHFASALSALATTSTNDSQFNPIGVAVDSSGNVYISDEGNYQVVKVPAG